MYFNAVILAGGRATRLDGARKDALRVGERTLLELAIAAAEGAGHTVVVGDVDVPSSILVTREQPAFSGPAAALAAGLAALPAPEAPCTLVLACDVPGVAGAVSALRDALSTAGTTGMVCDADGVVVVDRDDRDQYLLAIYRTRALAAAFDGVDVRHASLRSVIERLDLERIPVADGSSDDVDTWADARRLGVRAPLPSSPKTYP